MEILTELSIILITVHCVQSVFCNSCGQVEVLNTEQRGCCSVNQYNEYI